MKTDVNELLAPKRKGRPQAKNRPAGEMLLTLYQTQTAPELAKLYGVSKQTIYSWIREAKDELLEKIK